MAPPASVIQQTEHWEDFMKLLVFSDSHSASGKITDAIASHSGMCDAVIFLGDGLRDIEYVKRKYPDLCFFCVSGNCDFTSEVPSESVLDFDGIKVLVTHGHKYFVKHGYDTILEYAAAKGADAVFFGHTHVPLDTCEYVGEKRIQLFNPGSIGKGGTYGVVHTSGGVLVTSIAKI